MILNELFEGTEATISDMMFEEIETAMLCEAKMAWARRGNKVVRKYRCTSGVRKGRIVANAAQCGKPIDMKLTVFTFNINNCTSYLFNFSHTLSSTVIVFIYLHIE